MPKNSASCKLNKREEFVVKGKAMEPASDLRKPVKIGQHVHFWDYSLQ
jgi:hypothetical protein